jgi:hypothetical protein
MKIKNFQHIQDMVLAELYDRIMRNISGLNPDDPGSSEFKYPLSPRLIAKAIKNLEENGLTEENNIAYEIEISAQGILHVERMIEDYPSSDIALYLSDSLPVDNDDQNGIGQDETEINDEWGPLPIDRSSEMYTEAVEASEEAEKIIREDNGFASSLPEVRNHVVWSLGAGVNALKEGLISKEQVDSLLITPLKWITTKFAEGLMKIAANKALVAILAWLKSAV